MIDMNEQRLLLYDEIRKNNPNTSINNIILAIYDLEKLFHYEMEKYYNNYRIFREFNGGRKIYLLDYLDEVEKRFVRENFFMNYDIELLEV